MLEHRNALPAGYRLHWYRILSVLGQGGFGITYLAEDTNLSQQVAIKEFLPAELALREQDSSVQPITGERGEQYRWGLERFIAEAQTLARFKHGNIVRVFTVFSANNSAYMVMEFEQGSPLSERLKGQKALTQSELEAMVFPIMDGLDAVHAQGFIHRDIKPANIFIRAGGTPVLLDFGSARQALGEMTRTLTAMVSPGFAPFEQYTAKGDKQGPWTDIYGLGATMYRAATGKSPADAMDRSEALLHAGRDILVPAREFAPPAYTPAFLGAIDHALAFRPEERPQGIAQWRREFAIRIPARDTGVVTEKSEATVAAAGAGDTVRITLTPPPVVPAEAPRSRTPWFAVLAVLAIAFLLVLAAGKARRKPEPTPVTPAVSESPAPSVPAAATPSPAPQPAETTPPVASKPTPAAAPAARKTAAPGSDEGLMTLDERAQLVDLQQRLKRSPRDAKLHAEVTGLLDRLHGRVRAALQARDLPRAEAYINELLLLAPDNPRLREALTTIRKERATQEDADR